jgi:hypothetical protein
MLRPNPVMDVAAIGLTPIFPVIFVVPVVVIPDFVRIAKLPADPRFTAEAPITPGINAAVIRIVRARIKTMEKFFLSLFLILFMVCSFFIVSFSLKAGTCAKVQQRIPDANGIIPAFMSL